MSVRSANSGGAGGVSIVVPVFREGPNLQRLIERSFCALEKAGMEGEMIIVDDDSGDESESVVSALQSRYPVQIHIRKGRRGLSSAVLEGFERAAFPILLVMDGDLQHPPEMIPELCRPLQDRKVDFVMATRYGPGGAIVQDWPWIRRFGSWVATKMARPLAPLTDPMSGFFALRRETWKDAATLNPIGYKIALELYVKSRCQRPVEVPITFGVREQGESKLTSGVFFRYLQHLFALYRFRRPGLVLLFALFLLAVIGGLIYAGRRVVLSA
ncbi:MAG: polyprenol monophosphomannose synthase [Phycisphaerae bacterium]